MSALHKALHIERVVIVTPSVYGSDNSATLFGMKARGATARGVAVIDEKTSEADLDAMGQAGVRGIRLNLATSGVNDPNVGRARFQAAVERHFLVGVTHHLRHAGDVGVHGQSDRDAALSEGLLVVGHPFLRFLRIDEREGEGADPLLGRQQDGVPT